MEYKFATIHATARTLAFAALAIIALPQCYSEQSVSPSQITHTTDPNNPNGLLTNAPASGAGLTIQPSVDGGKCLQVQASTGGNGVGVGTCDGSTAQRWIYTGGLLQSVQSPNDCLDITGTEALNANATMTVQACDETRVSQDWIADRGIFYVNDGNNQFSLALSDNPPSEGSTVKLGAVNFNDAGQKWLLNITTPSGSSQNSTGFHITPKSTPTACLDVDGNNLVTNPCGDANSQRWVWLASGLLQSGTSCISLPGDANAGAQPNLVACDPNVVPELWISTGGEFVNNSVSRCADATGGANANSPVQVNACNGDDTQQWSFGETP